MGFDINDCRCDDCKKFKGINTPLKNGEVKQKQKTNINGEVKQKQKTNIWVLVKTLGIWFLALGVILGIWLIVAIWNAIESFNL